MLFVCISMLVVKSLRWDTACSKVHFGKMGLLGLDRSLEFFRILSCRQIQACSLLLVK